MKGLFFIIETVRNPHRARKRYLARSGSQSQRRIWFILPAHGASHQVNSLTRIDTMLRQ